MSYPRSCLLAACVTVLYSHSAGGQQPQPPATRRLPVVAVFDVESGELLGAEDAASLGDHIVAKLAQSGRLKVIPPSDIRSRLVEQKRDSYKACYDAHCQIEMGKELAANKSLATKLHRIGSSCEVILSVLDIKAATVDAAAPEKCQCGVESFSQAIDNAIEKISVQLLPATGPGSAQENKPMVRPEPANERPGGSAQANLVREEQLSPYAIPPSPANVDNPTTATRTLGWVSLGVGLTSLAVGGITGALAMAKKSDLDDRCPGSKCAPPVWGEVDTYNVLRDVTSAGLTAGGILTAAGAVLLLASPSRIDVQAGSVRATFSVCSAGITGTFE